MNVSPLARRLARLEQAHEQAYIDWVMALSDDELDAFLQRIPPDERAAFDAMTDDELERLAAGRMPLAEWQRRLQNARRTTGT
jgi:hypothetical protein